MTESSNEWTPSRTRVGEGEMLKTRSHDQAWEQLQKVVDEDPNTLAVPRKMTLVLQIKQLVSVAGNFPTGVSYYAIAAILSGVIWVSDTQEPSNRQGMVGGIMASALVGQLIDKVAKKS